MEGSKPSSVESRSATGPLVEEGFELVEHGGESGFGFGSEEPFGDADLVDRHLRLVPHHGEGYRRGDLVDRPCVRVRSSVRLLCLDLFEVRFESVETVFPAPFLFGNPADELVRCVDLQSTGPTLGIHPLADKPGSFEDPDVFGDRLQADSERLGQFIYRRVAHREASDDRPPGRIGQSGEGGVEPFLGKRHELRGSSTEPKVSLPAGS